MISVGDVQMGVDVQDSAGEHIGRVNEIINNPDPGSAGQHLFMQVAEGDVIQVWKPNLYIPFAAIASTEAGQCVRLKCTKGEAEQRYSQKPGFLT